MRAAVLYVNGVFAWLNVCRKNKSHNN